MTTPFTRLLALLATTATIATLARADTDSTITYQGQLQQGLDLVDGTADFVFTLHSAPAGGEQIGETLAAFGVPVHKGVFTVELDFGASAFAAPRWLQIATRAPAGGGLFITLFPRQAVTVAPVALYAVDAPPTPWDQIPGIPPGFADGIDNDTQYSFAGALALDPKSNAVSLALGSGVALDDRGGLTLASDGYGTGDFIRWNGTGWTAGSYGAGTGLSLVDSVFSIPSNAITTMLIANDAITNAKLGDSSVSETKLGNSAVTTVKIANLAITTAKLAADSVTGSKIADGNVSAEKLASNAVTTAKIANEAVTNAKIASVAATKITGTIATNQTDATPSNVANTLVRRNASGSFSATGVTASNTLDAPWIRAVSPGASRLSFMDELYPDIDLVTQPNGLHVVRVTNALKSTIFLQSGDVQVIGQMFAEQYNTTSDARLKTNVAPIVGAVGLLQRIDGVRHDWLSSPDGAPVGRPGTQLGLIAQDVLDVFPEAVSVNPDGYYSVDYSRLTPVLVEAVKELAVERAERDAVIEALENRIARLETILAELLAVDAERAR